jgi:hypothetical protein
MSVPTVVTGSLSPHAKLVHAGRQRGFRYEIYFDPYPSERTHVWRDGQVTTQRTRADRAQQRPYAAVTYYPYGGARGPGGGLFTRGEEAEQIDRSRTLEGARQQAEAYIERLWKSQSKEESEFRRHAQQKREALHRGEPYGTPHRYVRGRRDPAAQDARGLGFIWFDRSVGEVLANPLTTFESGAMIFGALLVAGGMALAVWPKKVAAAPVQVWTPLAPDPGGGYTFTPGLYGFATSDAHMQSYQAGDMPTGWSSILGGAQVSTSAPPGWPENAKSQAYVTFTLIQATHLDGSLNTTIYRSS